MAQLSEAMRLGNLGEQVVLTSEKAFERIRFTGYELAPREIYHTRRAERDRCARDQYQSLCAELDRDGLYIRDILLEEVDPHDPRLF